MTHLADLPHPDYDAQFYEGVPLKRLVAWLIDVFAISLLSLVATLALGVLTLGMGFMFFPLITFLMGFLYRWLTIASASATPGMRFMGIELRTGAGDRLDPTTAAMHTGLFLFLMATMIGGIATVISIMVTAHRQGLPDLILGTTAINRPAD